MTRTPRRRGRPPSVSRETIARAVIDVGFPNLTFAAVRRRLGVGESTLFRHAPDRDELIRITLDHVIEQTRWPSLDAPWREVLRAYALTLWHAWAAYPGAATAAVPGNLPLAAMRLVDDLCAMLMRQGFTAENAVLACDIVFDLVNDNRRGVEHLDTVVRDAGPDRGHLHELWTHTPPPEPAEHAATPAERSQIHAAMRAAITAAPINWFADKLAVVLDGIDCTLAPGPRPRGPDGGRRPGVSEDHAAGAGRCADRTGQAGI
ncbi:TetR/AcrR family transcriptional regulator [Micromonospora craniellae]|uniref:TetR family transcriptional regulator n=1 Tax=Micromonospora craniellae TaxID=2294034 RepID=A0A372G3Y6_9ACTN|nr:TetR family transcriptional regulator [Micromonospora craniellae]QOC92834.1 helix-turn-helix transcriptional regulator [Micromonospora craniellae]RFS47614.1 TetR family transcriptional regulator [Micromonospora craniellae]